MTALQWHARSRATKERYATTASRELHGRKGSGERAASGGTRGVACRANATDLEPKWLRININISISINIH